MTTHNHEPAGIFIRDGEQTAAALRRWSPEAPHVGALLTSALEDEEIRMHLLVELPRTVALPPWRVARHEVGGVGESVQTLMVEPLAQTRDRR
jgi:hypothetical protein